MPHKIYRDKTPPTFVKSEDKPALWTRLIVWGLLAVGAATVGWIMYKQPPARNLVCDGDYNGKLTSFGSCHEE